MKTRYGLMMRGWKFLLATFALVLLAQHGRAQEPFNLVNPLPPQGPPWLAGYQMRWPVRVLGDLAKQTAQTVLVSVPTGGWLRPDAADIEVQNAEGKLQQSIVVSSDPTGETIVQFKRNGNDPWYWVYGLNPTAPARPQAKADAIFQEGLTVEVRDWAGDDLSSWAKVRAGLDKSTKVIGNGIVGEPIQTCNPARPGQPHRFAASFRGFLDIKKAGVFRFFVNADDASFLFIDGFKVFERPGSNGRVGTIKLKEFDKLCSTVELKEGVHSFEVHQAVGNGPAGDGVCALLWQPPWEPKATYVLGSDLKHPIYARTAGLGRVGGQTAAMFAYGVDDTLEAHGLTLYLVRFEAQGDVKEPHKLIWDFGDGTTGTGRSVRHVYFKEGDYAVTLQSSAGLAPFRRTVHPWPEPGETSPLSLDWAVRTLEGMEWRKLAPAHIREMFAFLTQCGQPHRWRLLDEVTQHLLAQKDHALDFRAELYTARVEALAQLGRPAEAIKLAESVLPEFARAPLLQVRLQLAVADVQRTDFKAASKVYQAIIEKHGRLEHALLRHAAIRWGDMFADAGNLVRAAETYRLAVKLGGDTFQTSDLTDASTRGALLRIAEQKLKSGDAQQTRQVLQQIELNYPGQRIDGLYCFLRAEADRLAGRHDSALRHYETLLKLPQWAGYKDRTFLGIANIHLRRDEPDKAAQWTGSLKNAFPKFYETEKVADLDRQIEARQQRIKAASAKGNPKATLFEGYNTGFEPEETESFGVPAGFGIVAAPGMQGPHTAMIDVFPEKLTMVTYQRPGLKNLTPGGTYWVEIWYKEIVRPAVTYTPASQTFLHVYLSPEKSPAPEVVSGGYLQRNTQQWHKIGHKLKVPMAQDYLLKVYFYNQSGFILYDALSVQPVSDLQLDALVGFQEGPKTP